MTLEQEYKYVVCSKNIHFQEKIIENVKIEKRLKELNFKYIKENKTKQFKINMK